MEENDNVMNSGAGIKNSNIKNVIIGIIIVIAVIGAIVGLVFALKSSPEKAVKQFLSNIESEKSKKIVDAIDFAGFSAYKKCNGDYEKFDDLYDNYMDKIEDDEDEYNDLLEEYEEKLDDKFEDLDKIKIDIKKIKSAKKVKKATNLYKVNAKIKVEYKDDEDEKQKGTSSYDFYVYKKSGKYYVVGIKTTSGSGLLNKMMQF